MENWVLRRLVHFRTFCPVRRPASWVIVAALFVAGGCGGDGDDKGPTATVAKADRTTTTEARTPEEQVEAAYLKSWDVYAKAVRNLDPSGLDAIYADRALAIVSKDVEQLRSANTPVRCSVEHNYSISVGGPTFASVHDEYVNHCVLIDPTTGEPSEPDPNKVISETYIFKRFEDRWKVVGIQKDS
jgi:hypothetical protein